MSDIASCPFCNLNERILKENMSAVCFLSNPRKVNGHFLVTPKRHIEKPWKLTKKELTDIFELIFFIQKKLTEEYASGCDVKQNCRPFLKQSRIKVDHVHYHIYPREYKDELYERVEKYETDLFKDLTNKERKEMAKLIK